MEPFRFVHAARLLLDHQLHEVGQLPEHIRHVVEDATLIAFERVIDKCVEHAVDFLLLAGDSFDPRDQSLRGQAALVRGLERLALNEVSTVLAPGQIDPWSQWPADLRLASLVHQLHFDGRSEVQLTRNGQRLTTLKGQALVPRTIAVDDHILPDPGSPQGIFPADTGRRGCELIEVDSSGELGRTFLSTAPVRWESLHLFVTPVMTRDDLVREMRSSLNTIEQLPTDQVWLVEWHISGNGPLLCTLGDRHTRDEILAPLHDDPGLNDIVVHTRALHLPQDVTGARAADDVLAAEFDARIGELSASPHWSPRSLMDKSRLRQGPWVVPMESLVADLDAGEITRSARRLGIEWFAPLEDSSS